MLNDRQPHSFWVVTKEGGFARAADRLDMAMQTICEQVREPEKALGHQILKPSGRGVAVTEAGRAAFARPQEIFQRGQVITAELREAASGQVARRAVGFSDGTSKLAAHDLVPVSRLGADDIDLMRGVRLPGCSEGVKEEILAIRSRRGQHHPLVLKLMAAGAARTDT